MSHPGLTVCYIPGVDLRRVGPADTPFLAALLDSEPWARVHTIPTHELAPTFLTGAFPVEHRLFQAGMGDAMRQEPRPQLRPWEKLPDGLATFIQLVLHRVTGAYDLAVVPPWRRNRLELRRFKYLSRPANDPSGSLRSVDPFLRLGQLPSIFGVLGEADSAYHFVSNLRNLNASAIAAADKAFTFLELYALDIFQHWNLDDREAMRRAYREVDRFLGEVSRALASSGRELAIFSDHGQEPVSNTLDIKARLAGLNLGRDEFTYMIEVTASRFWFHTERARREVTDLLASIRGGRAFTHEEFGDFGFPSDAYFGDLHFILDPGWIHFPHDFFHPVANLYMGLSDWQQRRRIRNPRHRGSHGHLPHHESEQGFLVLSQGSWSLDRTDLQLVDVAPTFLQVLGHEIPSWMRAGAAVGGA